MKFSILTFGAAVTASLPAPAFAADLTAAPPAFTWTGFCIGANAGAWFAPANPSYEATDIPSAGFNLVPNGGGTEQIDAGANQLGGPVA
jgi:hypothetical protein